MLSTEWLSAFAPVGALQTKNVWGAVGACVFFHKPPVLWLVTAKHVLEKVGQQALTVLVSRSSDDGVISGVDLASRKVYTSAPTFPGNSGGPLIAVRSPFNPAGGMIVGRPTVLFAGIMLETKLLHAPDPTSRIPSLHLGVAVPADTVLALLNSDQARAITARVEALRSG